jgi:hypothetical protein
MKWAYAATYMLLLLLIRVTPNREAPLPMRGFFFASRNGTPPGGIFQVAKKPNRKAAAQIGHPKLLQRQYRLR